MNEQSNNDYFNNYIIIKKEREEELFPHNHSATLARDMRVGFVRLRVRASRTSLLPGRMPPPRQWTPRPEALGP